MVTLAAPESPFPLRVGHASNRKQSSMMIQWLQIWRVAMFADKARALIHSWAGRH